MTTPEEFQPEPPHAPGKLPAAFRKAKGFASLAGTASHGAGVFSFSLFATIFLPCLPLMIEWLRTSHITNSTVTLTATVLCAGFGFSAENYAMRTVYGVLFVVSLLLNVGVGPNSPVGIDRFDGAILLTVAFFHSAERAWWHLYLDKPFPDWVRT